MGLYEPNYFALALVLLIPLTFVFTRQQASWGGRAFWWTGLAGLLVCMVWTGSRGGFLGCLLSMAVLSFRMARRPFMMTTLVAASLLAAVLVFPTILGQRLLASGFLPGVQDSGVEASNRAHIDLLYSGVAMIRDKPIFGVGLGKFLELSSVYYDVVKEHIAHNTFIHIGAESGLPALVAFVILLVFVFLSLHDSGRLALQQDRPHVYEWTVAMQAGLIGYLLSSCFLSAQFEKFFWIIVFLSIALERVMHFEASTREEAEIARHRTRPTVGITGMDGMVQPGAAGSH